LSVIKDIKSVEKDLLLENILETTSEVSLGTYIV
jgi:hypothetical protein